MNRPLFTILIPTYNRCSLTKRAIDSVLSQSYEHWQLIVVDDGSTDDTWQYLQGLKDARIKALHKENGGECSARNYGVSHIEGDYVCYLDSDDTLGTEYLEDFRIRLQDQPNAIICSGVGVKNENDEILRELSPAGNKKDILVQYIGGSFNLMPFCLPKSIALSKRFDEAYYYGGDFEYLLSLLIPNEILPVARVNSYVHEHGGRIVRNVFKDAIKGYKQMEASVIQTIINNRQDLTSIISEQEISVLLDKKKNDYILATADQSIKAARELQKIANPSQQLGSSQLYFQRFKGLIKGIIARS